MATRVVDLLHYITNAMVVPGVARRYDFPPASLNTAELPASFPMGFRIIETPLTFQSHGGFPTFEVDFFIACEAVGQSSQPDNYTLILEMSDNLRETLAAVPPLAIAKSVVTWEIAAGNVQVEVAGTPYWAVQATITGKG